MELGLCIDPRIDMPWKEILSLANAYGITAIEPAGGGHVPKDHMDPVALAASRDLLDEFRESYTAYGLKVAALGVYGNPINPDRERAEAAHTDFVAMCKVAAGLDVKRVTVISGVPAGGPDDLVPNWIAPAVFAGWEVAYEWQWNERLIPYWQEACRIAADHGVTVCMEPIHGFTVYNPQTFERLADACGDNLRVSIDPSHLWPFGIDPVEAVNRLGDRIGFVQVKDISFNRSRIDRDGLLPDCRYDDWNRRTWVYRAVGFGHDDMFWRDLLTALKRVGYDDVIAIEIEEPFMSFDSAVSHSVSTLERALVHEPIPERNWFDGYKYQSWRNQ